MAALDSRTSMYEIPHQTMTLLVQCNQKSTCGSDRLCRKIQITDRHERETARYRATFNLYIMIWNALMW